MLIKYRGEIGHLQEIFSFKIISCYWNGVLFFILFFTFIFHDYELSCYVGGKPEIQVGKAKDWSHSENIDFDLKRCNFSTLLSTYS